MKEKKRILCIISHSPAFDSCFPLIERLHERGVVQPIILLGPRIRHIEKRIEQAFQDALIPYIPASLLRIELLSILDIFKSDAVLTHSDPLAYGFGKLRLRDKIIMITKKSTVFVQHGMYQSGLHHSGFRNKWRFYSRLMLLWAPVPNPHADFLEAGLNKNIIVTGILKANRLRKSTRLNELNASLGGWKKRVLICHNFGFEGSLYSVEQQKIAFEQWAMAADLRPNILFIIRSHRGRRHKFNEILTTKLTKNRKNIVLSERHYGLMNMTTIYDMLDLVDCVITHPSTVVLDAIYEGKPVSIFNSTQPDLDSLPKANTLQQIIKFIDDDEQLNPSSYLRSKYGEIDQNLDVAASSIESYLAQV